MRRLNDFGPVQRAFRIVGLGDGKTGAERFRREQTQGYCKTTLGALMAQAQNHFLSQQQPNQGMANASLQQMLAQKVGTLPPGMQMHQSNMSGSGAVAQEGTIIDDFEAAFQGCIATLMPGTDNVSKLTVGPDKLRSSMDVSIQQFTEQARKVEAYFLKKHATVAQQQPELILQEEIEEIAEEINRRDLTIRNHMNKVKQWSESLRALQNSLNERPSTTPIVSNQVLQGQSGQVHPDAVQQQSSQRR